MKNLILITIIISANFACAAYPGQEQVECDLPNLGSVKSILIESGTYKQNPDPNKSGDVIDNPGTLTLLGANGIMEKVNPSPGVGGIFNEYHFPSYFMSENDAMRPHRLKFETRQLGPIYIAYICDRPNALSCEDRSGNLTDSARVAINLKGERILNFNGLSLPLCNRKVLE